MTDAVDLAQISFYARLALNTLSDLEHDPELAMDLASANLRDLLRVIAEAEEDGA
jgi:hypothetical protein